MVNAPALTLVSLLTYMASPGQLFGDPPTRTCTVQDVLSGLDSPAKEKRILAADRAVETAFTEPEDVRELATYMFDPDDYVRYRVAQALVESGYWAAPAIAELIRAAQSEDITLAEFAVQCLGNLGHLGTEVTEVLLTLARRDRPEIDDDRLRALSIFALTAVDTERASVLSALSTLPNECNVALPVAWTRARLERTQFPSDDLCDRLRGSRGAADQQCVASSASSLGVRGEALLPLWIELLESSRDPCIQRAILDALEGLREAAAPAIPTVLRLARREDSALAARVALALGSFDWPSDDVISYLVDSVLDVNNGPEATHSLHGLWPYGIISLLRAAQQHPELLRVFAECAARRTAFTPSTRCYDPATVTRSCFGGKRQFPIELQVALCGGWDRKFENAEDLFVVATDAEADSSIRALAFAVLATSSDESVRVRVWDALGRIVRRDHREELRGVAALLLRDVSPRQRAIVTTILVAVTQDESESARVRMLAEESPRWIAGRERGDVPATP